jgi:hypothetical protein
VSFLLVRAFLRPDAVAMAREGEFFARRNRPVDFAAEIGVPNDSRPLRIVGVFGMTIGLGVLLLLIPLSSAGHSGKILTVALSTFGIGAVMWWRGGKT